ncbi:AAA family ATPase [Ligilactobacillus sp. WILCCON 0076]|uniref:AAA family ATPase n=1 Tax=Ligilactobacillus ubinensis TaxID=2876789 RepID=A0A9X2JLQ5_9LACO|nr:RNA polymerase recycling motor HelD [Ligilactobacillus ubinensis]MCP0887262.1 AAA family ATPase [Ligilactobacillus ubinensis]
MEKERQIEQQRVAMVRHEISNQLLQAQTVYDKAQKERSLVEKNYVQNARINTFEIDDRMETNAEIQQQKQLVAKNIENEQILNKQIKELKQLNNSPYFGRIDIQDSADDNETLYIGTASLVGSNQEFIIYDWRAPISSIYYNGRLGEVEYETPMGKQTTNLKRKRQFTINNGIIKNMFDTNELVGDEILKSVLGEHSDEYMHNIVATIQKEQNDIIRDTKHDLLLVQGVAGSGKTSAILQRIAFLLYHSRTSLNADQIVLFSPNLLFSRYISEVLPSLGERNMRQLTLAEFLAQRFQGLTVETLFERYEKKPTLSKKQRNIQQLKEQASFMQQIKDYVASLNSKQLQFTDIMLGGTTIFNHTEISEIFANLPTTMKTPQRFFETKNKLIKRLNKLVNKESRSDWVLEKIDILSDEQYNAYLENKQRGLFQEISDEEHYIAHQIVKQHYAVVYDALYNNYFIDIYAQYEDFLQLNLKSALPLFVEHLELHKLALEDCAPLLYLRDLITDSGRNHTIAHLFIDEIQDYTLSQLIYLHFAFPNAKLTLLGDSEQALFNPLVSNSSLLDSLEKTLNIKKTRTIALNKSYRSTTEITNFMKSLLPDGDKIQAFTRSGNKPHIVFANDNTAAEQALYVHIHKALENNDQIAIITANMQESNQIYNKLNKRFPTTLLTDADRVLPKGVIILPIYLAKGLEFDNVIAYDVSSKNYSHPSSIGILYTICSRAMHHLILISIEELAPVLSTIDPNLYIKEQASTF